MPDLPQTSTAVRFATAVRSAEGREGTNAFVEKRKPFWLMQKE
jgi:enoyl-CoA hydratase/carnithine racemase